METHQDDPTSERRTDPWGTVSSEFSSLTDHLRRVYNQVVTDGPTEAEIKAALVTLAGAWDQIGATLSTAIDDPETRVRLKRAAGAFASALGAAIADLGDELDGRGA